ncbi:hypothetical protein [Kineococcus sp. SYSU DK006]|uniref:hypothetical protein n=1 Tax=Kineococcus sp. SYSU DK006 TaxID=3383127 RepID=UPI003D7D081C
MSDGCLFDIGGSGRSWTDVLTNATYVHPLDAYVEPADAIFGNVPIGAIPALLHETSHHAALQTPVGLALALLEIQASKLIDSRDEQNCEKAVTLVLAIRTVLETYRPLLEGLALFAEFDTMPGLGRLQSPAHHAVLIHATTNRREKSPEVHWETHLSSVLSDSRMSRESILRRANVLSIPFKDLDGYLLGYSYVKTWRRYASAETPLLRDTDLAAFFLTKHFFADYGLVSLLLNMGENPSVDLFRYCFTRLRNLGAKRNWSAEVAEFEEAYYVNKVDLNAVAGFELTPRPERESPYVGIHDQLQTAIRNAPDEDLAILGRRSLLHLMSLPVDITRIRIGGDRLVASFRGTPVAIVPTGSAYTGEGGAGTLDIVDDTATRNSAVVLCVSGKVIHADVKDKRSPYMARWLRQFDTSRSGVNDIVGRLSEKIGASFDARYSDVRNAVRGGRLAAYKPLAFAWAGKTVPHDSIINNPHGFGGVLGSDLTYAFALLSAIDGVMARLEEAHLVESPELDLVEAAHAINERLAPYGFRGVTLRKGDDGTSVRTLL